MLRFRALAPRTAAPVKLGDNPVTREVASVSAEVLDADWVNGSVTVVLAGRLSAAVKISSDGVTLQLTGEPGERYRVERSRDLQHWEEVTTVAAEAGAVTVRDPAGGAGRQKFYRATLAR